MIQFFRQIRQGLINQQLLGKYLIYAVGEILLVVIGILLALQVNNWNESRKIRNEEQMVLRDLKSEFEENLQELQIANLQRKGVMEASNRIFEMIELNAYDQVNTIDSLLRICMINVSFDAKKGSLDNLIFSGRLEIISNENIRKSLISWTGLINDLREEEDLIRTDAFSLNVPSLQENAVIRNIFNRKPGLEIGLENRRLKEFQNISEDRLPPIIPSSRQSDYYLVFNDLLFENRLSDRYRTISRALIEGLYIEDKTAEILGEIESELYDID